MYVHRVVIGIQFNRKIFRVSSFGGQLIDEMLDLRDTDKGLDSEYFTRVSTSNNVEDTYVSLTNDNKTHELIISSSSMTLRVYETKDNTNVNTDRVIKEFELFWKRADKVLSFPAIRRIGIVAEYRLNASSEHSASNDLVNALLKKPSNKHSGRFHLSYENHDLNKDGTPPKTTLDDYWNTIFSFYSSDRDESPEDGKINANIDVQKYYSPAKKSGVLAELRKVKERFVKEKLKFKTSLNDMGLS